MSNSQEVKNILREFCKKHFFPLPVLSLQEKVIDLQVDKLMKKLSPYLFPDICNHEWNEYKRERVDHLWCHGNKIAEKCEKCGQYRTYFLSDYDEEIIKSLKEMNEKNV